MAIVQRDPRTSINFQRGFIISGLVLSLLVITAAALGKTVSSKCNYSDEWKNYENFCIFAICVAALFFIFTIYLAIRWRWVWMTDGRVGASNTGVDVEDLDPFVLAREGHALQTDAVQTYDSMFKETEIALDDVYA